MPRAAMTIWPMRSPACWSVSTSTAGSRWSSSATCLPPTARERRRAAAAAPLRASCSRSSPWRARTSRWSIAGHERFKPPLYVLDVVAGPLWRDFFTDTTARLGS